MRVCIALVYRWAKMLEVDASDDMVMSWSATPRSLAEHGDLEEFVRGRRRVPNVDFTSLGRNSFRPETPTRYRQQDRKGPVRRVMRTCLTNAGSHYCVTTGGGLSTYPLSHDGHQAAAIQLNSERVVEQTRPQFSWLPRLLR
jgi:hypothetical protein